MALQKLTLSHTTTIGTFVIRATTGAQREEFVAALSEALSSIPLPGSERDINLISQQLLMDETNAHENVCHWVLRFNGIHAPDAVQRAKPYSKASAAKSNP